MPSVKLICVIAGLLLLLQFDKSACQVTPAPCSLTYTSTTFPVRENSAPNTPIAVGWSSFTPSLPICRARVVSASPGPVDAFYAKEDDASLYTGVESLDYEQSSQQKVLVEVWDGTDPNSKDSVTLTIIIEDENDDPVFINLPNGADTLYVDEDAAINTIVHTVVVADEDSDAITFSIINQSPGGAFKFLINPSSGVVTTRGILEADNPGAVSQYTLTVRASDGRTAITETMTINIRETFDERPTFDGSLYIGEIDEDAAFQTAVTWQVTDPKEEINDQDTGDTFRYTLNGAGSSGFTVATDGVIKTLNDFDLDGGGSDTFNFVLTVTDEGSNTGTTSIRVLVNPVNEYPPEFDSVTYDKEIYENSGSGATVIDLTITDEDYGDTLALTILNGDDALPDNKFDTSGTSLITNGVLDYEAITKPSDIYILTVEAIDSGGLTNTAVVSVKVLGVNEFTPSFPDGPTISVDVSEDESVGATIYSTNTQDDDRLDDGLMVHEILSSNPSGGMNIFDIGVANGDITLKSGLDYETQQTYTLRCKVSDSGTPKKTSIADVVINVLDVNDNPPTLTPSVFSVTVKEDDTAGTLLAAFNIDDPDSDDITSFIFSLEPTSDPTYDAGPPESSLLFQFDLPAETLELRNPISIDPGDTDTYPDTYELIVYIADEPSGNTATATVYVQVDPVNDYDPVFGATPAPVMTEEEQPVGTTVFTILATDDDFGSQGEVVHSIIDGDINDNFKIDPASGEVTINRMIDYELSGDTIVLTILAEDKGVNPTRSASIQVTVAVTDKPGDGVIICIPQSIVVEISEEFTTAANAPVTKVNCTYADGSLTYSTTSTVVNVDTSGVVTLAAAMDYEVESHPVYPIEIIVTDPVSSDSVSVNVIVNLLPSNDNLPVFSAANYPQNIPEDTMVDTELFDLSTVASDDDKAPHDIIKYSKVSATPPSGLSKFALDPLSGKLNLISPLDRETVDNYELIVKVVDGGGESATATLTLTVDDVNDNTPECQDYAFNVEQLEFDTYQAFIAVAASDLMCSDPDLGVNGELEYILNQIYPDVSSGEPFVCNPANGEVQLNAGEVLDYEANANHQYKLELVVTDKATSPLQTTIDIAVTVQPLNEHSPAFLTTCDVTIDEELPIGSLVVDCAATDDDSSDSPDGQIVYEIVSGNDDDFFYVNETGYILIKNIIDFETAPSSMIYTLNLKASDGALVPKTATVLVTVTVEDLNDFIPQCTPSTFAEDVDEDTTVDVIALDCSDDDAEDTTVSLMYTLDEDYDNKFAVTAAGIVQVVTAIDFEVDTRFYDLQILVSDKGSHTVTVKGTVNIQPVNEEAPEFTPSPDFEFNVDEDIQVDSTVGTVTATDPDSSDNEHGIVKFRIPSSCNCPQFRVDDVGNITLKESLDYETATIHIITVDASDSSNTVQATVTVNVQDVNDNPPVFANTLYSVNIPEDPFSTSISYETVEATDADDGDNAVLLYVITEPDPSPFAIDSASGAITTAQSLDYDDPSTQVYRLVIEARDLNGAAEYKSATAIVIVHVLAVNEFPPAFISPVTAVSISEYTKVGQPVHQVAAEDDDWDGGLDGQFFFSLSPGTTFMIDENTGVIRPKVPLDRETADSYTVTVTVTDRGTPAESDTVDIDFTITDENDNKPVCAPTQVTITKAEDSATDTLQDIGAGCSDTDDGVNAELYYVIADVDGSPSNPLFSINNVGLLTLDSTLDYETTERHTITVHIYDGGASPLTSTVVVNVIVTPVNEFYPVLSPSVATTIDIPDSTVINGVIFDVDATDQDAGEEVFFSFSTTSSQFRINKRTGEIYLISPVTASDTYSLNVQADNGANPAIKSTSMTLTINVVSSDNNPPEFDRRTYFGTVPENASPTQSVEALTVTDPDGDEVTLTITGGNVGNVFGVNIDDEVIIADSANLDAETLDRYTLTVKAVDDGIPPLTASTLVIVVVTYTNDYAPQFSQSSYTASVYENELAGTTVIRVTASDDDDGSNGDVKYTITSGDFDTFEIDEKSGDIVVIDSLDAEIISVYTLNVVASDDGATTFTDSTVVTIHVLDINDEGPGCNPDFEEFDVQENTQVGTVIGSISCDDVGGGTHLSYYIIDGNDYNTFEIPMVHVPDIVVRFTPDYEQKQSYQLLIRVIDDGSPPMSSTATVYANILGVNEFKPQFSQNPINAPASENLNIGATIVTLSAFDDDFGKDGDLTFSIVSGNDDGIFEIVESTGDLYLQTQLNWESVTSYRFVVQAKDNGDVVKSGTATVVIEVQDDNDNKPFCDPVAYIESVPEDSPLDTSIIKPICSDLDFGSNFTYSIVDGNDGSFRIDPETGILYTNGRLDAEFNSSYVLTISVFDGLSSATAVITVYVQGVNEFPPMYQPTPVYFTSVTEDAALGTIFETVFATDEDALSDGVVRYSITGGNVGDVFSIDSVTGDITVKRALDRESVDEYTLEITATDQASIGQEKSALASVRVIVDDINDQTPYFEPYIYVASVKEDATTSSTVVTFTVYDGDLGSPNTDYTIDILTSNSPFAISGDDLVVDGVLDFETVTSYYLTIEVTDMGTIPYSSTGQVVVRILPVNEEPPTFDVPQGGYDKGIDENIPPGTSVYKVTAEDIVDAPGHVHSTIRYSITGGNSDGKFYIDQLTGDIYVAGQLDRETKTDYILEITATDSLPVFGDELTDVEPVSINVLDTNDNAPIFEKEVYAITVVETVSQYSHLLQLSATDRDDGTNADITISIVSGYDYGKFKIDDSNGKEYLTLEAQSLAWHEREFYYVRVMATDNGTPQRTSYARITIEVKPINQDAPVFAAQTDDIAIPEDILIGSPIYTVTATDDDYGIHGELSYYIDGGNDGSFHINKDTGLITVSGFIDRELKESYLLNITVYDSAENETLVKEDEFSLSITITDVNDNDPICAIPREIVYVKEMQEDIMGGFEILTTVTVTDPDTELNAELFPRVVAGVRWEDLEFSGFLYLEDQTELIPKPSPLTLDVVPKVALDRELHDIYSMVIEITDQGTPKRTALCEVEIHLIDVNDNEPIITPSNVAFTLEEGNAPRTQLWQFEAYDPDEGSNGDTFFTIIGGNEENHFTLDEDTGVFRTDVTLDREEISSYNMVVKVSDRGDPALTATALVNVTVEDLNDNPPKCKESSARKLTTDVREDFKLGMSALVVRSNDKDDNQLKHTERTYRIISGNDGTWNIDPEKGNIYLTGSLNRGVRPSFSFVIRIEDDGNPTTLYDECTANINVLEPLEGLPLVDADIIFRVQENIPVGTVIDVINCNAFDSDICNGEDYYYSIIDGQYAEHFYLEPLTGTVISETEDLDYEKYPFYNFVVHLVNNNGDESYAILLIELIDQNDNAPAFINTSPYATGVREDSLLGTTVIHVSAEDEDAGEGSVITYSLSAALADNGPIATKYFRINPLTGIIVIKEELDSEMYREIELTVHASDSGSPPLTASSVVTVQIVDVNDNEPVFQPTFYSGELSYLNFLGEPIITLHATDADEGAVVQFNVQDSTGTFTVNAGSGDVSLATGERPSVYTKYAFTATATDTGNPPLISTPINCRIDTFDPYLHLIDIHITGRTKEDITDNLDEFLEPLTNIILVDYPTGRIGLSHVTVMGDVVTAAARKLLQSASIIAHVYGVADDTADKDLGLANTKNFISQQYLYSVFASDDVGTPSASLSTSSDYPAILVEKHARDVESFWFSAAGIATIVALSLLGLLGLLGCCALSFHCCCGHGPGGLERWAKEQDIDASHGHDGSCLNMPGCRWCTLCRLRAALTIKKYLNCACCGCDLSNLCTCSCCSNLCSCCKSTPRSAPEEPEIPRTGRHGWGENVYKEYHRSELPVKGKAGEPVTSSGGGGVQGGGKLPNVSE
ncbi:protocadherin Fat 4-like isoform X2 [Glandiceps talaboti]